MRWILILEHISQFNWAVPSNLQTKSTNLLDSELNSKSTTNQSVKLNHSIQFVSQINQFIQSVSWILILKQIQSNSTMQSVNQIIWFIKSVNWTLILEQINPFKWTVHSNLQTKYWVSEQNYDFWTNQLIQLNSSIQFFNQIQWFIESVNWTLILEQISQFNPICELDQLVYLK